MPLSAQEIADRLHAVKNNVAESAVAAGRNPDDVTIVAISKYHAAPQVAAAAASGHRDFGENYVQEALAKQDAVAELTNAALNWHFTGRLQANKAKYLPGRFSLIHSLDSLKPAQSLQKRIASTGASPMEVLLQVNPAGEAQKGGVSPEELPAFVEAVSEMPGLIVKGLMFMAPFEAEPGEKQRLFARVRELRDALEVRLRSALPVLSMGMSSDFRQAVAEGATLVRIGTAIFGPRPPQT